MKIKRQVWWLDHTTRIAPLMSWCLEHHAVDRLLVVSRLAQERDRPELLAPQVAEAIQKLFADHILERRYAGSWPGTRLKGHDAVVTRVAFSEALIAPMAAAGKLLRDWQPTE